MADDYEFTTDWFTLYWENWLLFTGDRKISKILEIGSFEGRSTCAMIEHFGRKGRLQVVCVDDWQGSPEHRQFDMPAVYHDPEGYRDEVLRQAEYEKTVVQRLGLRID